MSSRLLGKVTRIKTLQVMPRLPPEVWLRIATKCTQSTIAALTRVQRSWYLALETELYRHVSVVFRSSDLVTSQACIRLLWSLAQTPRRGAFVHRLSVDALRKQIPICDQCKRDGWGTCTQFNIPRPRMMLAEYLDTLSEDAQAITIPPPKQLVFEIASRQLVQCSAQQADNLLILWTHIYLASINCPNLSEFELPDEWNYTTVLESRFLALFARPNAQYRQWTVPVMMLSATYLQPSREHMLALLSSNAPMERFQSRVLVVKTSLANFTTRNMINITELAIHGISAVLLDEQDLIATLGIDLRPYCEETTALGIGLKMQRYIDDLSLFAARRAMRASNQGTFDLAADYGHPFSAIPMITRLIISLAVNQVPFVLRRVLEALGPLLPCFRQMVLNFSTDEKDDSPAGFDIISAEAFAQILIPLMNLEELELGAFKRSTAAPYMLFDEQELVAATKSIGGCLSKVSFSEKDSTRTE